MRSMGRAKGRELSRLLRGSHPLFIRIFLFFNVTFSSVLSLPPSHPRSRCPRAALAASAATERPRCGNAAGGPPPCGCPCPRRGRSARVLRAARRGRAACARCAAQCGAQEQPRGSPAAADGMLTPGLGWGEGVCVCACVCACVCGIREARDGAASFCARPAVSVRL